MITGTRLNEKYKLGALQARYRENGYWYHPLGKFPGGWPTFTFFVKVGTHAADAGVFILISLH